MTPTKHPLCNDILRAPIGDENCDDLYIRREDAAVWSFWKPNAEELAALVMGGTVALCVCGQTHPPLRIHATTPIDDQAKATTPAESEAITDAIRGRHAALISLTKRIVGAWVRTSIDSQERRRLVDEFLDLATLNTGKGEVVRAVPADEPQVPTSTEHDADRYRADAEAWKAEAERWKKLADDTTTIAQRDAAEEAADQLAAAILGEDIDWPDHEAKWREALEEVGAMKAKAGRADRLQSAIDSVIDQLNRVSVENPNPAES